MHHITILHLVRYESILHKAFANMPEFRAPSFTTPKSERIYEYRSYESATEAKAAKKIQMFNEGGEMEFLKKLEPMLYFMLRYYWEARSQGLCI